MKELKLEKMLNANVRRIFNKSILKLTYEVKFFHLIEIHNLVNVNIYQMSALKLQCWAIYLKLSRQIKEDKTGPEELDICFCVIFDHY